MRPGILGPILFHALLAFSAPAFAAELAPLPDGFGAAAAGKTVPGVYASAVMYENMFDHQDDLKKLDKACIARGRVVTRVGDEQSVYTTWWLYRSATEAALFKRTIIADFDYDACRVTYGDRREVFRSAEKSGAWPTLFQGGKLKCSSFARRCYTTRMLGVKARCRAEGTPFQIMRDCVSIDRGPSRGMLLQSVYEADDMTGHGFEVRELETDASIDASLFDPSRVW